MSEQNLEFVYKIGFERTERNYRLIHYNTPWDNERELEDLHLMFDGKDLKETDLPEFKVIDWETLTPAKYSVEVSMRLYKKLDATDYTQVFQLKSLIEAAGNE